MDQPLGYLLPLRPVRVHSLVFAALNAMTFSANLLDGHAGLLAQFGGPSFSSGPPAIFMVAFTLICVFIIGSILVKVIGGLSQWSENNQQPVLTVPARVVTKRTALSVYSNSDGTTHHRTNSSTSYFATFEFSTGARKEFELSASEYGLVAEQDVGQLTFQGTRYQGFSREEAPVESAPTPATEPQAAVAGDAFCPFCGKPVQREFKFCPHCSKPLPVNLVQT